MTAARRTTAAIMHRIFFSRSLAEWNKRIPKNHIVFGMLFESIGNSASFFRNNILRWTIRCIGIHICRQWEKSIPNNRRNHQKQFQTENNTFLIFVLLFAFSVVLEYVRNCFRERAKKTTSKRVVTNLISCNFTNVYSPSLSHSTGTAVTIPVFLAFTHTKRKKKERFLLLWAIAFIEKFINTFKQSRCDELHTLDRRVKKEWIETEWICMFCEKFEFRT